MSEVAVLWWGSYAYGNVTVGDVMSVHALSQGLHQAGISFSIIQDRSALYRPNIPDFAGHEVAWQDIDPLRYKAAVFVCGPLPTEWEEGRARLLAFANARRIAVGGTLTGPDAKQHALDVFHALYCRDGFRRTWMDLAPSCQWSVAAPERTQKVALCWRGHDAFYGPSGCADALIEAATALVTSALGYDVETINTEIPDAEEDLYNLDQQFGRYALVITTRLHGTLLSLRWNTPCVSIDQVIGGNKVAALNAFMGWPHWSKAEDLSVTTLKRLIAAAGSQKAGALAAAQSKKNVAMSRKTLQTCTTDLAKAVRT